MIRRLCLATTLLTLSSVAQAEDAASIDDLLKEVERMANAQGERDAQRSARFRAEKSQQAELVAQARARLRRLEGQSQELESDFEENERRVAEKQETLRQRQGTRGELFGVVRRAAGDLRVAVSSSLVSAQLPGRDAALAPIATSKDVPAVDELRTLWAALQREMTRSGDVVRFKAPVVGANGETSERSVVRVGAFTALSDGRFLVWNPEEQILVELGRQPSGRVTGAARRWAEGDRLAAVPVDPSRGRILSLLVETPSWSERLSFGGAIGYLILTLGAAALGFGLIRLGLLAWAGVKVAHQVRRTHEPTTGNPLGRVLGAARAVDSEDPDVFEAKLDEAVLREKGRLRGGIWLVKVVQVAAPLLGLLGTVTGMINTFQAITLFGTGDPRLMAGGISEALVTTMLGLVVAIPLVLLTSALINMAKRIGEIVEQQSAGLIAEHKLAREVSEA